jgi:hypothetical protein
MVKEPVKTLVVIPPVYKTLPEKVIICEAYIKYEKLNILFECKS